MGKHKACECDNQNKYTASDLEAVQGCPGHAVILGEPHHHDLRAVPDQAPQPGVAGPLDVRVVEEGGVRVYQGVGALLDHLRLLWPGETRMEIGTWKDKFKISQ